MGGGVVQRPYCVSARVSLKIPLYTMTLFYNHDQNPFRFSFYGNPGEF